MKTAQPEKGAAMKMGKWARLLPVAALLLAGCKGFWDAPSSSSASFTLTNGGNISVSAGSTGTSAITVTPGSSFTGTVTLTCAVTAPAGASSPTTCSLSSSSLVFSNATAQNSTLTASTTSSTTTGVYEITVTGVSGSITATTTVCVAVGTSSSNCTPATTSGNFYILNSNSIAGYSISASTLTSISGSSYTVSGASAVAMAPSGNFLYVASTGSGINLYTITNPGALTPGASIDGDNVAQAIQVDPSGRWLLDASAAGNLKAIPITSSGTLDSSRSVQSQPMAGIAVQQMAITPNGALVAVALGSTGTQAFAFTSGNSSPLGTGSTAIRPWNTSAGSAVSVAMDPQNRLLYIGEIAAFPSSSSNSGALRVFTISGSSVTEFTYTTPYASGGLAPHFILPNASGTYVYVANGAGNSAAGNITGFAVTTTALTTGSTVAAGAQPLGLAEDSTHSWVFEVGSTGSPYFDAYTFDPTTTGQLDSQITSTSAATSIAIVAAP
jgi:6-phosphogluconolactonase (cycloisomerase 2 family)